jgi:histone-lysine N-methyltransferase SETD2
VIPKVLCTNRELALMNGIAWVFPGCHNILCCWHINKNILANCKTRFSNVEWQQFMERWNMFVSSTSVELFDAALGVFKEIYSGTHPAAW